MSASCAATSCSLSVLSSGPLSFGPSFGSAGPEASAAGRLRRDVLPPDLTRHRIDAPVVVDDRPGARLLRGWHQAAPPSLVPSSTISASTTSSSAGVWLLSSAEPDCELAWAAWVCW